MRLALTILALVLDALCLALMGGMFLISHPSNSAKLGVAILATVVAGNLPALIWSLFPRRPADQSADAAGIFT